MLEIMLAKEDVEEDRYVRGWERGTEQAWTDVETMRGCRIMQPCQKGEEPPSPHPDPQLTISFRLPINAAAESREEQLKSLLHSGNRSFMCCDGGHYYAALDTWGLTAESVPSITVSIGMEKIILTAENSGDHG
jgi:hypothetical protein